MRTTGMVVSLTALMVVAGCGQTHSCDLQNHIETYRAEAALHAPGLLAAAADKRTFLPVEPNAAPAGGLIESGNFDSPSEAVLFSWLADAGQDEETNPAQNTAKGKGASPSGNRTYVPWRQRKGQAYPGDFWTSFGRWGKEMPATLWDDAKATATNRFSLATLAIAGIAGVAITSSDLDDRVSDHYTKHGSQLNKSWDSLGGFAGSPAIHFPIAGAAVISSLAMGNDEYYEKSTTLMNALAINGMTTLALKWTFRTESPNGDELGWPSGHSSSSFCFATVMYHQYGPWVGTPMLAFATFVAYERVDARNHDFSDVISGSLIGIAIGHAVTGNHEMRILGMEVAPYVNPKNGTVGLALMKSW